MTRHSPDQKGTKRGEVIFIIDNDMCLVVMAGQQGALHSSHPQMGCMDFYIGRRYGDTIMVHYMGQI